MAVSGPRDATVALLDGTTELTYFLSAPSCYGTVSSLNGEPEQGVAVEAVGQSDCSIYGEDTITDEEGRFRLRGLLVRLRSWRGLWGCLLVSPSLLGAD